MLKNYYKLFFLFRFVLINNILFVVKQVVVFIPLAVKRVLSNLNKLFSKYKFKWFPKGIDFYQINTRSTVYII